MSSPATALLYYVKRVDLLQQAQADPFYIQHFNAKAFNLALTLLSNHS